SGGKSFGHVLFSLSRWEGAGVRSNKNASLESTRGAWRRAMGGVRCGIMSCKKNPENKDRFRGNVESDPRGVVITFFYPDFYCRPRSFTGSCACALVGCTTDREFTCTSCGASGTLPRRLLFGCDYYSQRDEACQFNYFSLERISSRRFN